MSGPRYTPVVETLPSTVPFVGPETQERTRGRVFRARVGANENVFGPSPKAVEAMARAAHDVWQYADPENHDLKHKLAVLHGIPPENIVVGEGIDALLGYLARLLIARGTPVVTSLGAYPTFNFHVAGFGGELLTVPYKNDAEDPDRLIERTREANAALIYFANPDNPMGSWHPAGTVQRMIDGLPETAVLCLDEAYIEFAPEGTAPPIDISHPRVIRMRTFSKAHGMAGARIGYAIAEAELARSFNKIRNHFGINRLAQAGAIAALDDTEHLQNVKSRVAGACRRIAEIVERNGLRPLPTATNFVAIDCGQDEIFSKAVLDQLIGRDIFVRMPFVAPQSRCIRISAGRPEDLDLLEAALPMALNAARASG